jgi:hypothetical protein
MPKAAKAALPAATVITVQPRSSPQRPQPPARRVTAFEPLLDLGQAAALLGMHWKTLETMARAHRVPALKVGNRPDDGQAGGQQQGGQDGPEELAAMKRTLQQKPQTPIAFWQTLLYGVIWGWRIG